MNRNLLLNRIKIWFQNVDWLLLTFLVLVVDVKLAVKVAAIVLLYVFRPDFRFGIRFKSFRHSRLPIFYCVMPAIVVLDWIFRHQFSLSQSALMLFSLVFWGLYLLIAHRLKLFADKGDPAVVHRTITLFFLLNNLVSIVTLIGIMVKTGSLNPYQFLGMDQTYFISTGDFIKGISFDFSLTNALISTMGVVYFMQRKQYAMVLLSMFTLLLTGSNYTNLLMGVILVFLFFYRSPRAQKIVVSICLLLLVFFMKVVSPENKDYAQVTIAAIANEKVFEMTPQDTAVPLSQKQVVFNKKAEAIEERYSFNPTPLQSRLPGKLISFQETIQYLLAHPMQIPFGAGAGHFSSKLAFRASALGVDGGYPQGLLYIDPDFLHNHLSLFLYYFTKGNQHHSIIHTPFSVYNQGLGEYGLVGLLSLFIFYFGYFIRRGGKEVYNWLLLLILAAAFFTDYWFEQLSVVIIFELLFYLNIRHGAPASKS
jgi:hypothetical protein